MPQHITTLKLPLAALLLVSSFPSWCEQASDPADVDEETAYVDLLLDGRRLVEAGNFDAAITGYFDKVLSEFDKTYGRSDSRFFCARSPEESLLYLLLGANEGQDVRVLSSTWADSHFLKGYALVAMGRLPEARSSLEQAVALSPQNSQYLSELGHLRQLEKDWNEALETFQTAERAAEFSPPESRAWELGVARRGVGYVLIELGRLDEAEQKYLQCLDEDPNDAKARSELAYIRKLRSRE